MKYLVPNTTRHGIYAILNLSTMKLYVGKSKNIRQRFSIHLSHLRRNNHFNNHIQYSYNKYGEEEFVFFLLEECENLADREQYWLDFCSKKYQVYNKNFDVKNFTNQSGGKRQRFGVDNPFYGKRHLEEAKKRMSESKKSIYFGKDNPNYGKKRPGIRNHPSKLKQEDVMQIRKLLSLGLKHQEIAEKFNICRTAITRINSGNRWSSVK